MNIIEEYHGYPTWYMCSDIVRNKNENALEI